MRLPSNFDLTTEALASAVLILTWLVVMRSTRYSKWQLAMISLPGTVMHEALHGMVGLVLFAKPKSFSIFPNRQGNTWVLGSVGFTNLNIWNAAPVAFAPLLMLGIGWLLYAKWMLPTFLAANYWIWLASGYVTACAFFSCIPSTTDFKAGAMSGLMYGCIGFGVWYFVQ
jgi:hypothetical protein